MAQILCQLKHIPGGVAVTCFLVVPLINTWMRNKKIIYIYIYRWEASSTSNLSFSCSLILKSNHLSQLWLRVHHYQYTIVHVHVITFLLNIIYNLGKQK